MGLRTVVGTNNILSRSILSCITKSKILEFEEYVSEIKEIYLISQEIKEGNFSNGLIIQRTALNGRKLEGEDLQ